MPKKKQQQFDQATRNDHASSQICDKKYFIKYFSSKGFKIKNNFTSGYLYCLLLIITNKIIHHMIV